MAGRILLERFLFPPAFLNRRKLGRELKGKTVLITGASSGIGERLAYLLAEFDVHLVLVARRGDKLAAIKADIERKAARASAFPADLRNREETDALLAYLKALPDGLDAIVSNAGHSIRRSLRDSLDRGHDFSRTMAINYFAPVQLLLGAIPLLEKKRGRVVNVSSASVLLLPAPRWAAYLASKAAFDAWFRSAAPELRAMGIAPVSVYLPLVRTPMIAPTVSYRRWPAMQPLHAARIVARSLYARGSIRKPWWLIFGQLASALFGRWWTPVAARGRGKGERT